MLSCRPPAGPCARCCSGPAPIGFQRGRLDCVGRPPSEPEAGPSLAGPHAPGQSIWRPASTRPVAGGGQLAADGALGGGFRPDRPDQRLPCLAPSRSSGLWPGHRPATATVCCSRLSGHAAADQPAQVRPIKQDRSGEPADAAFFCRRQRPLCWPTSAFEPASLFSPQALQGSTQPRPDRAGGQRSRLGRARTEADLKIKRFQARSRCHVADRDCSPQIAADRAGLASSAWLAPDQACGQLAITPSPSRPIAHYGNNCE